MIYPTMHQFFELEFDKDMCITIFFNHEKYEYQVWKNHKKSAKHILINPRKPITNNFTQISNNFLQS
jgi:hypothetical protein